MHQRGPRVTAGGWAGDSRGTMPREQVGFRFLFKPLLATVQAHLDSGAADSPRGTTLAPPRG